MADRINRIVFDDGWNLPVEIFEELDFSLVTSKVDEFLSLCRANAQHEGKWITLEIAKKYHELAMPCLIRNGNNYAGEVRTLGNSLIRNYGMTELEAFNVLRGFHIEDYVNKYWRIKTLFSNEIEDFDSEDEEVQEEYEQLSLFA